MNLALPPYILLIPFVIVTLIAVFFSLVNISHLLRYGARDGVGFLTTFFYVSGGAIIMFMVWSHLPDLDWTTPINLLSGLPNIKF